MESAASPLPSAPRTLKLTLAYDGGDFHGWQTQPGVRTVQEEIEQLLRRILRHPLNIQGASRTDAGVHALGQVATVVTTSPIPAERLRSVIAQRLPEDIALVSLEQVADGFDATRAAIAKRYRYRIYAAAERPVTQLAQRYTWYVWHPLDLERLAAAAQRLVGRHDFAGFQTAGSKRKTTIRTIHAAAAVRVGAEVQLEFVGDGFLYNQVRNMVGTLYEIGRGHWPVERIDEILATRDRRRAGTTAPPQGLCLMEVRYPSA